MTMSEPKWEEAKRASHTIWHSENFETIHLFTPWAQRSSNSGRCLQVWRALFCKGRKLEGSPEFGQKWHPYAKQLLLRLNRLPKTTCTLKCQESGKLPKTPPSYLTTALYFFVGWSVFMCGTWLTLSVPKPSLRIAWQHFHKFESQAFVKPREVHSKWAGVAFPKLCLLSHLCHSHWRFVQNPGSNVVYESLDDIQNSGFFLCLG
jgi:hypothetical protein